ncbi:MAG TPA: ferredoxin reductase family protein [Acidimicrobiales bacterium]|nr:ferredoxin reductase family protein [Acidimicrobiales bacterium]
MTYTSRQVPARREARGRSRRRPGHAPVPHVVSTLSILARVGLAGAVVLAFWGESISSLEARGGWLTLGGRLAGLVGTYLMLVMVVLMSRVPWLERSVGQDQLVRWHRRIGGWPVGLIALHVLLITWGYAQLTSASFFRQLWTFIMHYPDVLESAVALGLLAMAGVTSARIVRRRLEYETWWVVHLYVYLALGLAFFHQIKIGVMFLGHPGTRALWIATWVVAAVSVASFRVALPVIRNLRHQLRVSSVREETPGVYSVVVTGRQINQLAVSGGQYFQWRFMTRELWWHAHPYSLSALPQAPYLRVTVKGLGGHSNSMAHLKPGTRVIVEGPYGTFTRHSMSTKRALLVGAGVGVTPLLALLEDLPHSVKVTVVIRESVPEDVVHRQEFVDLVAQRHGTLHELIGTREQVRFSPKALHDLVGDLRDVDVYVCGPDSFTHMVVAAARQVGARPERIHLETFSF